MRRRCPALTSPALLLAVLMLLTATAEAQAHRLEVDYRVLPERKVQVESWFDVTGDAAKGAQVQVLRADSKLLTEGHMDGQGVFIFSYGDAEPLKVVVTGGGHRKELNISAKELGQEASAGASQEPAAVAAPRADRSPKVSFKDALVGVGFLLAVAAFALSVRNARQLREMQRQRKGSTV